MLRRVMVLGYGMIVYLFFLGVLVYTIGFLANAGVPRGIDEGAAGAVWMSVLINVLLLELFAVQHTVMARPAFKRWWTRFVPQSVERSTFVLSASVVLALVVWLWRPLPATVWTYEPPGFRQPFVYRLVRHPIMVGFLIAFWATPDMSAGRLLFAVLGTGYILVGIRFEERDLRHHLGEVYVNYERRVPRFVPRPMFAALREPEKRSHA